MSWINEKALEKYTCEYCGLKFRTKNAYVSHIIHCNGNPKNTLMTAKCNLSLFSH